ncbi:MAG: AMP-binding protein, partial [Candidatus Helarchaeota archaeon]
MAEKIASKFWTKSYDKHLAPTLDLKYENLGEVFARALQKYPDKAACIFMNRTIPYSELWEYIQRFATFLQENGLKKGDVVAINIVNSPQYLITHFGTLLAGGVCSGCSPLLSQDEVVYQLNDSEAKFIVTLNIIYAKLLKPVLDKVPKLECVIPIDLSTFMGFGTLKVFLAKLFKKIPSGKVTPFPGKKIVKFVDTLSTPINVKPVKIDPEKDLAFLYYTGGTTGPPKGTELTHKNIHANILQWKEWAQFESEIACSAFPYFHIAGTLVMDVATFVSGTQILIPNPRDTNLIIKKIIEHKPTVIANVPTLYMMIKSNPKSLTIPNEVLDNISIYVSGAAPFPAESIREFEEHMNAQGKVLEVYGMTEASPLVTANPRFGTKKIGTVGLPLPNTEIKLVNIETGEAVGIGERGEILVKGPQITSGYYKKPEATAQTIDKDGWLHTGDVGEIDEDGYIKIVDRTKDMLNVSGYKVYSVHVEDVLTKHPDIQICAIIGVENPKRPGSEIVKAVIQLQENVELTKDVEESIKKFAEENLSKYENPKIWE